MKTDSGPRLIPKSYRVRIWMRKCGHQVQEDIPAHIVTRALQETSRAVTRTDRSEEWGWAEASQVV